MITVFRCFDYVLICLKMSLVFLSLPQRQHKMQIFRKLKSANSLLMLMVYKPASEQLFLMVFIFDTIYMRSHQESKVRNLFAYVFTLSLPQRCLPGLIKYCGQFKYTSNFALMYTLKITYSKGI